MAKTAVYGQMLMLDKICDFLSSKVIGKLLVTDELKYSLDDGKLEGVYSDNIVFANLTKSEYGANFDLFIVSKEKIYKLDQEKQHIGVNGELSGMSVFRYELANRKSTDTVTGTLRLLTTTVKNQTAQAIVSGVFDFTLADNALHWREQQLLYRDQMGNGGKYHSVAFDSKNSLFFENEKLRFDYDGVCYDVESSSFRRSASKDIFPRFLGKEK